MSKSKKSLEDMPRPFGVSAARGEGGAAVRSLLFLHRLRTVGVLDAAHHAAHTSIPSGQASSSARRPHGYGGQCGEECKTQGQTLRQVRSLGRRPLSDGSAGGAALHNRRLSLQQFYRPGVVVSVAFDGEARGYRLLTAEEQHAIVERAFAVDKTRFVGQRRSGNRSRSAVVRTRKMYQVSL